MNKNFKKILAVALTLTILLVSVVTLSGCNFFRKNNINDFADELFPSLFSNDAMSANFFCEDADTALGLTPMSWASSRNWLPRKVPTEVPWGMPLGKAA